MKHYIIPVFIPHYGCTHACVFCNQQKITGRGVPVTAHEVQGIIEEHLARITEKRHIEVAFYGGSFTALAHDVQCDLLAPAYEALQRGEIHAIRLSTRPDSITKEKVENLLRYGVSIIELGVQSLDDKVLNASNRGHTSAHVLEAVALIKRMGLVCGIQVMPGLPKEDWASLITTVKRVIALAPDFVRIYPTVVIAHTQLAEMYAAGSYKPLSLAEGVVRAAFCKLLFEQGDIPIIRTGLQATADLGKEEVVLAGPYHPAFGEMVDSYLFYLMLAHFAESIRIKGHKTSILVHHHPRDTSKVRGMRNGNIKKFQDIYNTNPLILIADGQKIDELGIEYENNYYAINKKMLFNI